VAQDVFLQNEGNTAEELIKKVMSKLGVNLLGGNEVSVTVKPAHL
jgi:hypothetical protein